MKPTKKTTAKRVFKKRPAKRAVKTNSIEHKVMKLKNRINDCYATPAPDGRANSKLTSTSDSDLGWVSQLLLDIRDNNWTTLSKEDMLKCNGLWRSYA